MSEKQSFLHDEYRENLSTILQGAREDYKQITFDRHSIQLAHLRNYLWISLTIMTAEFAVYSKIYTNNYEKILPWIITLDHNFYALALFAFMFAGVAFVMAIDTCRGKDDTIFPAGIWTVYTFEAWKEADGQESSGHTYIQMITQLEKAILHHRKIAIKIGERLWHISCLILISIIIFILSLLPY